MDSGLYRAPQKVGLQDPTPFRTFSTVLQAHTSDTTGTSSPEPAPD